MYYFILAIAAICGALSARWIKQCLCIHIYGDQRVKLYTHKMVRIKKCILCGHKTKDISDK